MQTVERLALVSSLEFLKLAVSEINIIEQSDSFIFQDNHIYTYNDEIACSVEFPDLQFTGAVPATLLSVLREMKDENVTVAVQDNQLVVRGGKRVTVRLNYQEEISLPFSNVEPPKKWRPVPTDLEEAIRLVWPCAEKAMDPFKLTCVHLNGDRVEAANHREIARYKIDTGLPRDILLTKSSIRHVCNLAISHWALGKTWIHFKSEAGFVFSIRIHQDDSYELKDEWFKVKGNKLTLPVWFVESAGRAAIFASEKPKDEDLVKVNLKQGKAKIAVVGATGQLDEVGSCAYDGDPFSFMINPNLLRDIAAKKTECKVSKDHLKIDTGKFEYVALLELES